MRRMHLRPAIFGSSRRTAIGVMLVATVISTGCTTNYLTNSTEGTYGVPMTERTIPQRLLDRSIEHTVKINVYGLKEDLQQTSRMGIDSFNSEVLLTGEVPTQAIKEEVEKVVSSMPDVRRVYNELDVSASKRLQLNGPRWLYYLKINGKVASSDGVKASQVKAVTNAGVVYIMGRVTPTQQSHLIDIANSTVGVTELVLLTTVVDDRGVKISEDDIMYEDNLANPAPVAERSAVSNVDNSAVPETTSTAITATPIIVTEEGARVDQSSSSEYIDLYQNQ